MILGKIPITWDDKDYIDLPWVSAVESIGGDPTAGFDINKEYLDCFKNVDHYKITDVPKKFIKLAEQFKLKNTVVVLSKMIPGQILPFHIDKYSYYSKKHNIKDKSKIKRIIIFLENIKPGHQLWIENQFCQGEAGSYFGWNGNTKHMAANLGETDRYVLQITGTIEE